MRKTYNELLSFMSFLDRFEYLKLPGHVGSETFGSDRWLNQNFYKSDKWIRIRREVIVRDNGCIFGLDDYPIIGQIVVHHINPITSDDIYHFSSSITDPNNLISVSQLVHRALHYGDRNLLPAEPIIRRPGDTILW